MLSKLIDRFLVGFYAKSEVQSPSTLIFTVPNAITSSGIIATALYQFGYMAQAITGATNLFYEHTLFLIFVVIISDVLDGFFARALRQSTRFGEILDPARDRYFIFAVMMHMLILSNISVLLFIIPIVVIEIHISLAVYAEHMRVHFLGKMRMLIHMCASLLFVAQITLLPITYVSVEALLSLALIGSFLAWTAYGAPHIKRLYYKMRHL